MKRYIKITLLTHLLIIAIYGNLNAQGVGINNNGAQPDASSMLDVISSDKGVLIPRMTTNEQLNIASPATGLLIFNTDSVNFWFFDGTLWRSICNCDIITSNKCPSCSNLIDARDGQTYKTIAIGTQCWMRENLNYGTMINVAGNPSNNGAVEKYCWHDSIDYCNGTNGKPKVGGHYQWNEIMNYTTTVPNQGICPAGWHIPTDMEWQNMEVALGMCPGPGLGPPKCAGATSARGTDEGNQIKLAANCYTGSGYTNCGTSCFDAILGGETDNNYFYSYGVYAYFWTSTQYDLSTAWKHNVYYNGTQIARNAYNKNRGFFLRCVKN